MYKIKLDDDSFIIVDENYKLTLFRYGRKKIVTVKDYLIKNRLWKYHLVDFVNGKKIKRYFSIETIDDIGNLPVGQRIKFAKDVRVDDLILGKDGEPRRVKELHTGEDEMFEINIEGTKYVVNGGHILELVDKETGEHLEMPVNVYMHMDNKFKKHYAMEKIIEEEKENG